MVTVLLVDDHTMFREGLKEVLRKHSDIRVGGEAGSAEEVLGKLHTGHFDVILLDISLPGRSGLDILNQIKAESPDQAVLILSMHPEDQYAVRMLKAGASGYITKESAADDLVSALRRVAAGRRYISPSLAERLASEIHEHGRRLPHQLLSNREFEVMCALASGRTLKEIADIFVLSEKTVTTYRARILEKLGLRNNVELTHYVLQNKLLP